MRRRVAVLPPKTLQTLSCMEPGIRSLLLSNWQTGDIDFVLSYHPYHRMRVVHGELSSSEDHLYIYPIPIHKHVLSSNSLTGSSRHASVVKVNVLCHCTVNQSFFLPLHRQVEGRAYLAYFRRTAQTMRSTGMRIPPRGAVEEPLPAALVPALQIPGPS